VRFHTIKAQTDKDIEQLAESDIADPDKDRMGQDRTTTGIVNQLYRLFEGEKSFRLVASRPMVPPARFSTSA
jgi:hypothetical protein